MPRGAMPSNDGCGTETHGVSFGMAGGEGRPDGTLAAEGKHSQATTRCLVTTQSCDVALPAHRQRHQRCRTPLQMKGLGHRPLDVATRHSANRGTAYVGKMGTSAKWHELLERLRSAAEQVAESTSAMQLQTQLSEFDGAAGSVFTDSSANAASSPISKWPR